MKYKEAKDFIESSYSVKDVRTGVKYWQKYLLSKCSNLFEYSNLPDSLPAWEIEKSLLIKGSGAIIEKGGRLYCPFSGSVFGYDEYIVPNRFTYANPVIGSGSNLLDGKDCAIIWNSEIDKLGGSWFWDTVQRYARMLADLESTFESFLIYGRAGLMGQANNQTAATGLDNVLKKLEAGEVSTVVNSSMTFDSLKLFNIVPSSSYADFIRCRDYLINCFYNSMGMQTLEEKPERMITGELSADKDILKTASDALYKMRTKNVEHINEVFGTNIEIRKNEVIADNNEADEEGEEEQDA